MVDESLVGTQVSQTTFPVDRSKLAELARAYGDHDPMWHDLEAAQAAGFDAVPVPPTVTVMINHWRTGGTAGLVAALGADLARVLHGNVAWEYLVPVCLGDELTARQRVASISKRQGKRGGTMTLIGLETEFTNQRGEVAIRCTDTLIEREI